MFKTLLNRDKSDTNWHKIPWNDPDFSRRMLNEHLSQEHDLASRRLITIQRHIDWIQRKVLNMQGAEILDVGCGPGLYINRLAVSGHHCTGIDFSPASITYAREHDSHSQYILGDARDVDYGEGYDLVMLVYGELNAFSPDDARQIVNKAYDALRPEGKLLLEVSTYASVYRIGQESTSWHTAQHGLFADEPYLCLTESQFVVDRSITDHYVYLMDSNKLEHHVSMHYAYTDDEYRGLLSNFSDVRFYPSLTGDAEISNMFAIVAQK